MNESLPNEYDDVLEELVDLVIWLSAVVGIGISILSLAVVVRTHGFHGWTARISVVTGLVAAALVLRLFGPTAEAMAFWEIGDWVWILLVLALAFVATTAGVYGLLRLGDAEHTHRDHDTAHG